MLVNKICDYIKKFLLRDLYINLHVCELMYNVYYSMNCF